MNSCFGARGVCGGLGAGYVKKYDEDFRAELSYNLTLKPYAARIICFKINSKFLSNKNIIMSSFKSSGDIQKKKGQTAVSDNQSSSVTLNELTNLARNYSVILNFSEEVIQ